MVLELPPETAVYAVSKGAEEMNQLTTVEAKFCYSS